MTKEKLLFNKSTLIPFFHLTYAIGIILHNFPDRRRNV
jgi:hypothetical protein